MAKKVLLTGGSGFIGRNLLECLSGSFDITAPNRAELDLTDARAVKAYLKEGAFDAVVHAAGSSIYGKGGSSEAAKESLKMFQNIAGNSRHFGKMVQLGSGAEYGKSQPIVRVKEEEFGKRIPSDDYGRYKYECSRLAEKAENITCLRIFGCYGKYEDYSARFISNAICRSLFSMPITIANQNVRFSYIYIEDFARIAGHFIENVGEHKFYNAVPDETADLLAIAGIVKEISGNPLPITVKNPGMGNEYTADNSRLRQELPGFQFTGMESGIGKLYSWYSKNKDKIEKSKLG